MSKNALYLLDSKDCAIFSLYDKDFMSCAAKVFNENLFKDYEKDIKTCVFMKQIHSNKVLSYDEGLSFYECDGLITDKKSVALCVLSADCLPLVLWHKSGFIANLHSGRLGTFSNILTVRTVSEEYLIAMKLMSARPYKNDLSDIFGILAEQYQIGNPISLDTIKQAVIDLYGSFDFINPDIWSLIEKGSSEESLMKIYNEQRSGEMKSKELLVQFDENYKNVLNEDNLENILKKLKEK